MSERQKLAEPTRSRIPAWLRPALLGVAAGVAGLLLVEIVMIPRLALTHRNAFPLEIEIGDALVNMAARGHGGNQQSLATRDPAAIAAGQTAYRACIQCHGGRGDGKGSLSPGLYPPPASLMSDSAKKMSDGEL